MIPTAKKIRNICQHPLIIELVLVGSFLSFAIFPRSLGDIMRLGYGIFLMHLLLGEYRILEITTAHITMACVLLALLLLNLTVPQTQVRDGSVLYLMTLPGMVLAIHVLASKRFEKHHRPFKKWILAVSVIVMALQIGAYHAFKGPSIGFYENEHHLGLFCCLMIPTLAFFVAETKKWERLAAAGAAIGAFYLLWESSSRVSWLVFFSSILITTIVFFRKKQVIVIWSLILGVSFLTASLAGQQGIAARLHEFWDSWRNEERIYLWADTIAMLRQGSVKDWLFGRGIGSFGLFFKDYQGLTANTIHLAYNFPHNIVLQLLFENGLIGFSIVVSALTTFVVYLWRGARKAAHGLRKRLYVLSFTIFWIILLQVLLTKSLYSKYIIYAFSLIIGIALVLFERDGLTVALSKKFSTVSPEKTKGIEL